MQKLHDPGVHRPFNDDGVSYCGWSGDDGIHGGCGHIWPCPSITAGRNHSRIAAIAAFLSDRTPGERGVIMQVVKVQEEAGEAAEALLGWLAENPRKPVTPVCHLSIELADVAISALVAMSRINPQSWQDEFSKRLQVCADRLIPQVRE